MSKIRYSSLIEKKPEQSPVSERHQKVNNEA